MDDTNEIDVADATPAPAPVKKTYAKETAWVLALFNAGLIIWGLGWHRTDVVDFAKYLIPFTMGGLTAALGANFVVLRRTP